MSKKLRNIIIFSLIGLILIAIGIYSLVAYLNYEGYRKTMEAAIATVLMLK